MGTVSHDSETPAQGKQVITVCAFIHANFDGVEKVFLVKRAQTKKFLPGVFELPGGHVDYGEDIIAGLQREVQEEMGMRINVGDPFVVFTYTNKVKGSHSIQVTYFARFEDPVENIRLNQEDHSEYCWVAESELADYLPTSDREHANVLKGFALLRGEPVLF